jgi:hypothetical protein
LANAASTQSPSPSLEERVELAQKQRDAIREEVEAAVPKIGDKQPLSEVAQGAPSGCGVQYCCV